MKNDGILLEIEGRIMRHLAYSKNDYSVKLIWRGYVAALLEWGKITADNHDHLRSLLDIDEKHEDDLRVLFLDTLE